VRKVTFRAPLLNEVREARSARICRARSPLLFPKRPLPPGISISPSHSPWPTVTMGGLAKAAVILAKLNLLFLVLGLVLALTTLLLAGLSVRLDNEVPVVHLWPSNIRTEIVKRTLVEDVGVTLADVFPAWEPPKPKRPRRTR
jgi:hypothetical protein